MSDWYQWVHNWYHWIQDAILEHAGEWWTYLIVSVLTWLDGFFPVTQRVACIAMSSLSTTHGGPVRLWVLIPLVMAGAYAGDVSAYWIGRSVPRHWVVRGERGERTFTRAQKVMYAKGPVVLLSARFIPLYRIAMNMTAGGVRYPFRKFLIIDAIATTLWASFSVGIGLAAGSALSHNPLLGIITGVVIGVGFGWLLGKLGSWHLTRRGNNRGGHPPIEF